MKGPASYPGSEQRLHN